MSQYANTIPSQNTLKLFGSEQLFALRRVYCIGRNYRDHALEMGHDPDREPPFYFQKSPDNLIQDQDFVLPPHSQNVQHEVELVIALKSGGRNIKVEEAQRHIFGYAVGLDMTRRDLQGQMKAMGRPWEIGKSFEGSAPIGLLHRATMQSNNQATDQVIAHAQLEQAQIELRINGKLQQSGNTEQMIWSCSEIIAYLSQYTQLASGDIIMTGTPAGVGAVKNADQLLASIDGLSDLQFKVTNAL